MTKAKVKYLSGLFLAFVLVAVVVGCTPRAASTSTSTPPGPGQTSGVKRVDVVYFHRQQRCYYCLWAEQWIRYTLENYFREELTKGNVTFLTVNVQDPSSAAIVKKYGAYTSQLFVNRVEGNNERIEHVVDIWNLIGNGEAFSVSVRNKVMKALE